MCVFSNPLLQKSLLRLLLLLICRLCTWMDTQLVELPEAVSRWSMLTELDISDNALSTLPDGAFSSNGWQTFGWGDIANRHCAKYKTQNHCVLFENHQIHLCSPIRNASHAEGGVEICSRSIRSFHKRTISHALFSALCRKNTRPHWLRTESNVVVQSHT